MPLLLESSHVEDSCPDSEGYTAMCPYSREAHLQLLFCYYVLNDAVMMKRLLQKLMRNLDSTVQSRTSRTES